MEKKLNMEIIRINKEIEGCQKALNIMLLNGILNNRFALKKYLEYLNSEKERVMLKEAGIISQKPSNAVKQPINQVKQTSRSKAMQKLEDQEIKKRLAEMDKRINRSGRSR